MFLDLQVLKLVFPCHNIPAARAPDYGKEIPTHRRALDYGK
jgi:hypothetical protein